MSRLQCRGSIAGVAVVVALLSSRPAVAQLVDPSTTPRRGGYINDWVTGVQYDVLNQAKAERRLQHVEAKLNRDEERGNLEAADRDVRRIDKLRYRIAVDEWLIRKNSLLDPCYYPKQIDALSRAAIAQATIPPPGFNPSWLVPRQGPMDADPTILSTIVNAGPAGTNVAFAIDGVAYQAAGGSRQNLYVSPNATITYDAGGSLGQRRYLIALGVYEFRSTAEGWALYKLPDMP